MDLLIRSNNYNQMRSLATKIFILLLVLTTVQGASLLSLGLLYTKCNVLWVNCVAAAGGV